MRQYTYKLTENAYLIGVLILFSGMDIIGEKEDCESDYIRELLRTEIPARQLRRVVSILESDELIKEVWRNVCRGAYILLGKPKDDLFTKLSIPVWNGLRDLIRHDFSRGEREQLLDLFRGTNLDTITARLEKLSHFEDESSLASASASSSLSPNTHSSEEASAEYSATSASGSLVLSSASVQDKQEVPLSSPCAFSCCQHAPPIYGPDNYGLNKPYSDLLRRKEAEVVLIHPNEEKPFEVWSGLTETEFNRRLMADNALLGARFIKFMRFVHGPVYHKDEVLISGSCFFDGDERISRLETPYKLKKFECGYGTMGLFLRMEHPDSKLGSKLLLLTSAHVVFSELNLISASRPEVIEAFNMSINFAHYDPYEQPDPAFSNSLDFCVLEVPSSRENETQNMTTCKLRVLLDEESYSGATIVKYGAKTGMTVGQLSSLRGRVNNRESVGVTSWGSSFCQDGDSGAAYLYLDEGTRELVPIAIHRCSSRTNIGIVSGGCNIVDCLRKYVQKTLRSEQPPTAQQVIKWFSPFSRRLI